MFSKAIVNMLLLASSAVAITIDSAPKSITPGESVVITFTADNAVDVSKVLACMRKPTN
jgi:hypothetical protein